MENLDELKKKLDFSYLSSIQYKFNELRTLMFFIIGACGIIVLISCFMAYNFANNVEAESRRLVYVVDKNDQTNFIGLRSIDKTVNREAEAKYHMKNFHKLFFTMYPDMAEITKNVREASNYGDKSIIRLYKDFTEKEYYSQIIQGNVHQLIDVDSVLIDTNTKPFKVRTICTLTIIRESTIQKEKIITDNYLIEVFRTENNPSGFFIERLQLSEIKVISEESRDK
jgi:conjugative transposon TraK protein